MADDKEDNGQGKRKLKPSVSSNVREEREKSSDPDSAFTPDLFGIPTSNVGVADDLQLESKFDLSRRDQASTKAMSNVQNRSKCYCHLLKKTNVLKDGTHSEEEINQGQPNNEAGFSEEGNEEALVRRKMNLDDVDIDDVADSKGDNDDDADDDAKDASMKLEDLSEKRGNEEPSLKGNDDTGRLGLKGNDDKERSSLKGNDDTGRLNLKGNDDKGKLSLKVNDDTGRSSLKGNDDKGRSSWKGNDETERLSLKGKDNAGRTCSMENDRERRSSLRENDDTAKKSLRAKDDMAKSSLRGKDDTAKSSMDGDDDTGRSRLKTKNRPPFQADQDEDYVDRLSSTSETSLQASFTNWRSLVTGGIAAAAFSAMLLLSRNDGAPQCRSKPAHGFKVVTFGPQAGVRHTLKATNCD